MRCLALGQGWSDETGGQAFLLSRSLPARIERRCCDSGVQTINIEGDDISSTLRAVSDLAPEAVVVDGYHFDVSYFLGLRECSIRVLQIDDLAELPEYGATLILNQNFHADEIMYLRRAPKTRLLIGPRYAVLRREFRTETSPRQTPEIARNLLVMAGGSDPSNHTVDVLNLLAGVPEDINVRVVTGPANVHVDDVALAGARLGKGVEVFRDVANISSLMRWADFAITAGGTTTLELAAMGVPFAGFSHGFGEERSLIAASGRGACKYLGTGKALRERRGEITSCLSELITCPELRSGMARKARESVDGMGVRRVIDQIRQ